MPRQSKSGGGNPAKPGVAITLDKPRRVLFDLNALAALEEQTGKNMLSPEGWAQFEMPLRATDARLLLWAGLLHEQPELTQHDVGALITPANLEAIGAAIEAATTASLPEPEPEEAPARPLAETGGVRRQAGSSSGPAGATTSA